MKRICGWCGKEFEHRKKRVFCGVECGIKGRVRSRLEHSKGKKTKVCSKCKEELPRAAFYVRVRGNHVLTSLCRECCGDAARRRMAEHRSEILARNRERRRLNPDAHRRSHLKCHYGEEAAATYLSRKEAGTLRCGVCGSDSRLGIDHDHGTGVFRGILCNKCNGGLGMFNDDVHKLRKAVEYMEKFEAKNVSVA